MKTPEDEAFDELARKQGAWGGGFTAKRKMAADKLQEPEREALKLALEALKKAHHAMQTDMAQDQIEEAITAIKEALAQPEQEPVEYQMRMRPTWEVSSWSDWKKCSRDAAGDYDKTPKLHDWEYETRKLYAQPITQTIPQIPQEHSSNRQWVGLTGWEREAIALECGAMSADWLVFMEAVEKALKEKNA